MNLSELFSAEHTVAARIFEKSAYPWEIIGHIKDFIYELGARLDKKRYEERESGIWVAKSAVIDAGASIYGPAIIDEAAEIRKGAFIRGSAIIGRYAVVGNSTEIKNSILFDSCKLPHFSYAGDSILGYCAHLGAGAIISNQKSDKSTVFVDCKDARYDTGLKKCGAFLGDYAEIGANAVLCPGALIGRNSIVYPLSRVRGYIPENSIFKGEGEIARRIIG